ncbi:MAG: hypothetical protein J6C96_00695 [Oscillospiraceae bacterium]|nr:hypothetical protein [Oscillospiraceae bacterium]
MKLGTIGYNYTHSSDFVMDRPNGTGCWHMLVIKTPAQFTIKGKEFSVRENSFVVISPDAPCRYF